MTDEPLTWHYGLMAEYWAEFSTETPELDFFRKAIDRFGQPVLDLACGAGRLLVPLLQLGYDVDGCDISADMLSQSRVKAQAAGFDPRLYAQPMHAFELPRKYRTIYLCGSFGLGGSRENDQQTLVRCYEHLEDGGALLVNIEAEYSSESAWRQWLSEGRKALPEPWPEQAEGRLASDGSQRFNYFRTTALDPLEQSFTRQVRLEKHVNNELVASEEYTLRGNIYFMQELLLMLKVAGFRQITVQGDYTDQPATPDSEEIVFTAVR